MTNQLNTPHRKVLYSLVTNRMIAIQHEVKNTGEFNGQEFAILFQLFGELAPPEDFYKVEAELIKLDLLVQETATFDA